MTDNKDAEELLAQSKDQKRHNTETQSEPEEESPETLSLEDAIADAYEALDAGDLHENLTVRDDNMAALVAGMQATGDLEAVGKSANRRLDRDFDVDTRAGFLRAVLRVGLDEVASEKLDAVEEGYHRFQQQDFEV